MPDFARYFVRSSDPFPAEANERTNEALWLGHTSSGNNVVPLIDGDNYFPALRDEIDTLLGETGDRFFYFTDWGLGLVQGTPSDTLENQASAWPTKDDWSALPPLKLRAGTLHPADSPAGFVDLVDQMVTSGVDVRALGWINPLLFSTSFANTGATKFLVNLNVRTMHSIEAMRALPSVKAKGAERNFVLNLLGHPMGAIHLKIVVAGSPTHMTAFVGGMDLISDRDASRLHPDAANRWHDAAVQITGPAAAPVYALFKNLFDEQVGREVENFRVDHRDVPSHVEGTGQAPVRLPPALPVPGTQHVQVLRTMPQMNFAFIPPQRGSVPVPVLKDVPLLGALSLSLISCLGRLICGFERDPLSFAPKGAFEFRRALRKAILGAQRFVYMEDQGFQSTEIMSWLNQRLKDTTQAPIKVILMRGGDPGDGANVLLDHSIDVLADGVTDVDSKIAFYERSGVIIHAKLTVVDDQWICLGSANAYRRSLYTDGECSVAVLDDDDPSLAKRFRIDLWAEHCGYTGDAAKDQAMRDALDDVDAAMGIWGAPAPGGWWADNSWGAAPNGPEGAMHVHGGAGRGNRFRLPFSYATPPAGGQVSGTKPAFDPIQADREDADSRLDY